MSLSDPNGSQKTALVINSDEHILEIISNQLALFGWHVEGATTIPQALRLLRSAKWQLIFFSRTLHGKSCLPVERQIEGLQPDAHLFLLRDERATTTTDSPARDIFCELQLSRGDEQVGVQMLHNWMPVVEERIAELQDAIRLPIESSSHSPLIGMCPAIHEARRQVAVLASTFEPCLITGEEGTGKLSVARNLHELRYTGGEPMTLIMCEEENEKFGIDETSLLSKVMRAKKPGTIFLRQLEMASDKVQVALLNLDFDPSASVSIVASSCRDLFEMAKHGNFSAELCDRLKNRIYLPPLNERREDVGLLIPHFVKRFVNKPYVRISRRAWVLLQEHDWKFNLPELHSVALNAVASGAGAICVMDIPFANEHNSISRISEKRKDVNPTSD